METGASGRSSSRFATCGKHAPAEGKLIAPAC